MKKPLIILLSLLLPAVMMAIWGFVSFKRDPPNGFNRIFKNNLVVFTGKIDAPERLIAINSINPTTTYFTSDEPQKIVMLSHGACHLQYEVLQIPKNQWITYNYSVAVDRAAITVFAGNLPAIFRKEFGDLKPTTQTTLKSKHFTTAVQFAPKRYFIRVYSAEEKDYIVAKVNESGQVEGYEHQVSYLTHDNGMSSQAHMLYSPENQRLFLVQKLSNQIRCLDTNMNLVYSASTIDTFTTSNIKEVIKKEKNSKVGTQSAPPRYTNYAVAASGNYLYCYSKIRADNQPDKRATLDVYAIQDGSYQYSISLPNTEKQNLLDIKIYMDRLVALIGNGRVIMTYEIKEQMNPSIGSIL